MFFFYSNIQEKLKDNIREIILMIKKLISTFLLLSLLTISMISSSIGNIQNNQTTIELADYASSPTEYFNETQHPRYNLVARPLDIILEPHKGIPLILEYNDTFKVILNSSFLPLDFNLTLINDLNTVELEILNSYEGPETALLNVKPMDNIEGLYDLQLNSTTVEDYQTHCVKIVKEKKYPFKFLHLSDSHFPSYSGTNTTDIDLSNIEELKNSGADFAIFTGDLIEGGSAWDFVNPVDDKPLAAEIQLKLGLWALDLLNMPVYIIGGNHDLDSSTVLPDEPEEIWIKYLGSALYPIIHFELIDWVFIGYSATRDGISDESYLFVDGVLDAGDRNENPCVLYYHSDYQNQPSNLRNRNRIEVMLYGHEHNEELYVQDYTLYHCEAPLFYNGSSLFTVLNKTHLSLNDVIYDFTLSLQPPTESTYSPYLLFGIIPLFVASIIFRKKKIVKT